MANKYLNNVIGRTKEMLFDTLVWNKAEHDTMQRAATAQGLGLDPTKYVRPFPGTSSVTTNNISAASDTTTSGLAAGASKGLLAGVAGAGIAAASVLGWSKFNDAPKMPAVNPPEVNMEDLDLEIKWWVAGDGVDVEVEEVE